MSDGTTLSPADLETLKARLSANEKRVLLALAREGEGADPKTLVEAAGFNVLAEVMNAANWLSDKGLVDVFEVTTTMVGLDAEGQRHAAHGLPERRALQVLAAQSDGRGTMKDLAGALDKHEVSITLGWLKRKGWATITKEDGETVLVLAEGAADAPRGDDETLLERLAGGEQAAEELDEGAYQALKGRKGILREREATDRTITMTAKGRLVVESGLEVRPEIVQLTAEHISSGAWKDLDIRPYDVHAFAPTAMGGKPHPLTELIEEIREVFVEMGFAEIATDFVESTYWNMDALFIPQDHPAREMQDTFYLSNPETLPVSDEDMARTKAIHEHGGDTGSRGWGGLFDTDVARRGLLRTHTTVGTIRHLAENPEPACKVFSIGRVFRNETMDATHLPEFHQVEGIIKEPGANFRVLVGVLREFYRRMGFPKVRVRPGYFPYTEPSMEIDAYYNGRWMELGGSGIFRPEVMQPLGVTDPVCAWGLGLERLAMMRFGFKDIRDIYVSDVDWLRNAPLRWDQA